MTENCPTSDVAKRVQQFVPTGPAAELWDAEGPAITAIVEALAPTTAKQAGDLMSALCGFAVFTNATGSQRPLGERLTPAHIERYVAGLSTEGASRTIRSLLRSLGREANPAAGWRTETQQLGKSTNTRPYTELEIARHLRAARSIRTTAVGHTYLWCLVGGVALGADAQALKQITPNQMELGSDATWVHLPGRPIPLPVTGVWAIELHALAEDVEPDQPILGPASRINNAISKIKPASGDKFQVQRCRATWIVALINAGTPLPLLLSAAGLTTPGSLDTYYRQATPPQASPSALVDAASMLPFGKHS